MMLTIQPYLSRFNIRREVLYLAQAMAEACVITPWLTILASSYRPVALLQVTKVVFIIIAATIYMVRLLGATHISMRIQRAITASIILGITLWALYSLELVPHRWPDWAWVLANLRSLVDILNIFPPGMLVMIVIVFLWWRGLQLAQQALSLSGAGLGFHLGVLLFALFLILTLYYPQTQEETTPCIMAFFFCQLLTISLTRVETVGYLVGGRRSPFSGWWVTVLTLSTGAIIALAGVIYGIIRGVGLERIMSWIAPVLAIIFIPFAVLISPLLELLASLLEPIATALAGIALFFSDLAQQLQSLYNTPAEENEWASAVKSIMHALEFIIRTFVEIAVRVLGFGKGILVLACSILILIGIVWALQRRQARLVAEDEEREMVWSAGWWLTRLRQRLEQRLKQITNARNILSQFGLEGLFTAITIRRIYAQLQHLAAKRGYPRALACTPYEYLSALNECFPNHREELAHITQAYVDVRYGELPEHPQELEEIRAAWDHIRAIELQKQLPP